MTHSIALRVAVNKSRCVVRAIESAEFPVSSTLVQVFLIAVNQALRLKASDGQCN